VTAAPTADPASAEVPLLRSAVAAARRGGVREVWWRGLGATAFRRLDLFTRPLLAEADGGDLVVGEVDDVDEYRTLRPSVPARDVERRLARGDRCGAAWLDGRLVGVRWMSLTTAAIDFLALEADLGPGVVYYFDAFTAPELQGRGIGRAMSPLLDARSRALGAHTVLNAIFPGNPAGLALVRSVAANRPAGWLGTLRLGSRRAPVHRAPASVIRDLRPVRG
jgi:GNAT superfamily N-acetyltransferase